MTMKRKGGALAPKIAKYARTAYAVGRAAYKSYTKVRRVLKAKRKAPQFNTGYSITNMSARNTARRKMRHRRLRNRDFAKALAHRVSFNFQKINEIETGRGALLLPNIGFQNATQDENYVPLHIYALDRRQVNASDTVSNMIMQLRHYATVSNGDQAYQFVPQTWQKTVKDGDVANSDAYAFVSGQAQFWCNSSLTSAQAFTKTRWYQKSVDVEMVMYGQTNQDTLYRVDIVRLDPRFAIVFSEDFADTADVQPIDDEVRREWNSFWHSMVAPYTQNPLHKPIRNKAAIKIVKSYKFKIPEQSADFDRIPCVKTKFSIPMDRVCDYAWKKGVTGTNITNPVDPEDDTIMNNQTSDTYNDGQTNNGYIHPAARYFMIVRATNNDRGANLASFPSTFNVARGQDPTYDIKIRSKYLVDW